MRNLERIDYNGITADDISNFLNKALNKMPPKECHQILNTITIKYQDSFVKTKNIKIGEKIIYYDDSCNKYHENYNFGFVKKINLSRFYRHKICWGKIILQFNWRYGISEKTLKKVDEESCIHLNPFDSNSINSEYLSIKKLNWEIEKMANGKYDFSKIPDLLLDSKPLDGSSL